MRRHSSVAADEVGDMHFEELSGKMKGEFTIRLNQEHRVGFTMDDDDKVVSVARLVEKDDNGAGDDATPPAA